MKAAVIIVGALLATDALALDMPQGSDRDNRIQHVNYHEGDVVVVSTIVGVGTRIVFAPNETIIDVASGFPGGWDFNPLRHILYLMPKSIPGDQKRPGQAPKPGEWNTNLMVATNMRLYDFDLRLLAGDRATVDDRVAYRVQFKYPVESDAQAQAEIDRKGAQEALRASNEILNVDYTMQASEGASAITPGMAYDDGVFTYLQFPGNGEIPAVFLINPDDSETLVNTHVDPSMPRTLVVQRVAAEFVLRLGEAVVGVYNESFQIETGSQARNTTVPNVKRTDRGRR